MRIKRIATWNVDGLNARRDELLRWLRKNRPDVMGLQEIKTNQARILNRFTGDARREGYYTEVLSEPSKAGVAILSRHPLTVTQRGLPGRQGRDTRLLTARTAGLSFTTVYVPSGSRKERSAEAEAIEHKRCWLDALIRYLGAHRDPVIPAVVCGDFNVTPAPIDGWRHWHQEHEDTSRPGFRDDERSRIHSLQQSGWFDLARSAKPDDAMFSWWSSWDLYIGQKGLRLDLVFGNRAVSNQVRDVRVDCSRYENERHGKNPDHAPVIVDLT